MAILFIIKANLKSKKGNFISLFILIMITALSLTTIISVSKGSSERLTEAGDASRVGDIISFIQGEKMTQEILQGLKASEEVSKIELVKCITSSKVSVNGKFYSSSAFMIAYEPTLHSYEMFNEDLLSFSEEKNIKPNKGEVYVPVSFKSIFKCEIGDEFLIATKEGPTSYRISRFYEEPLFGASMIGVKLVLMNDEDLQHLYLNQDDKTIIGYQFMNIFVKEAYKDKLSMVVKDLNEKTEFMNAGRFNISKTEANAYTLLFTTILSGILWAFALLLFIIILVIIGHSVSTSIEMDYVSLGILKAQGFRAHQIRLILLAYYLLAGVLGSLVGMVASVAIIKYINGIFLPVTGLLTQGSIRFLESICAIFLLLGLVSLYTYAKLRKVIKISPVQAISAGHAPVYFSGRMDFSVTQSMPLSLGAKMILKHISGNGIRYMSTAVIMALLVFFTMTVTSLGQMTTSENADVLFGSMSSDICVKYSAENPLLVENIKAEIEEKVAITKEFSVYNGYFTVDNMKYLGHIIDPIGILGEPLKGRLPKYDNEIIITEIMSEGIEKDIGESVILKYGESEADYMIVGTYQNFSDTGKNFSISLSGIRRLAPDFEFKTIEFGISDRERSGEIVAALKVKYETSGSTIEISNEYAKSQESDKTVVIAVEAIAAITYVLVLVFGAIVTLMISQKTFYREQLDLGILKSVGFTTLWLRGQFTLRFLTVVVIGSLFGMVANFLLNDALMSLLLRGMGMTHFTTRFTAFNVLIPILCICGCTAVFSWFVSRKIKGVSPKNLIQE